MTKKEAGYKRSKSCCVCKFSIVGDWYYTSLNHNTLNCVKLNKPVKDDYVCKFHRKES